MSYYWDTWDKFKAKLGAAKPGDVVEYYGHCGEDRIHFDDLKFSAGMFSYDWHKQKEIAAAVKKGKASVLILAACATDKMAEYLASPLQKNTELNAVVGTNIEISPTRVGELLGWFKEALGKGETVQKSVDYANDEMAKIWRPTALEPVMPRLSCYGPDINLTLEQIRQKARKK